MSVHDLEDCHFLINCKQKSDESIFISFSKSNSLIENMLVRFEKYFRKIVLPEIVSRKLHYTNDNDRKRYCFCKSTSFGNMIFCENPTCSYEWFHYCCVGITRALKGRRVCGECMKKQNTK